MDGNVTPPSAIGPAPPGPNAEGPLSGPAAATASTASRHAQYGEHWGEGAARCFSLESDILDEDHAVRLMPVPDNFLCPISAAIMVDPAATVDGCVYERQYIERWFRERRQQGHNITSPITGLALPSATLMPLVALQRAIEVYLAHRPELKREHMAGRSFEEAAQLLQSDLFEKQQVHATTQDKLKRLKHANKELLRALQAADDRIRHMEHDRMNAPLHPLPGHPICGTIHGSGGSSGSDNTGGINKIRSASHEGPPVDSVQADQNPWSHEEAAADSEQVAPSRPLLHDLKCVAVLPVRHGGGLVTVAVLLLIAIRGLAFLARLNGIPFDRPAGLVPEVPSNTALPTLVSADAGGGPAHPLVMEENPALADQLHQIRHGSSDDEKQRAVFMLRVFAAEQPGNQVAVVRAGAIRPLLDLLSVPSASLREESARALWTLARNKRGINLHTQRAVADAGGIEPLVQLLTDQGPRVRVVAAAVLNDLAIDNLKNQVAVARAGAIKPLVQLLQDEDSAALVMAASLLKSLASSTGDKDEQVSAALLAAVRPLVLLLKGDPLLAQEQASSTLGALAAYSHEMQLAIAHAGAVVPLVDRLRGDMMQGTAALALGNLAAGCPDIQIAIGQAGAILPLVKLLEDAMPGVREHAARALWNLAMENIDHQVAVVRAGAAIPLVALLKGDAQEQATIALLNLAAIE